MNHLTGLNPEFLERVDAVLAKVRSEGFEMKPFYGLRSPFEQAKLWRQSRTWNEIEMKMEELKRAGGHRIAACIGYVGPCSGSKVTNATPGMSWHQYGEAVDCFAVDHYGRADWNSNSMAYKSYVKAARLLGLRAGADFDDIVHIQLKQKEPHQVYSIVEIEKILAEKWPSFAGLG
jgi:hypothetical protein